MGDSYKLSPAFKESETVAISGKILVATIIIPFMVLVFVLFLYLYAKCFWVPRGHRSLPSRTSRFRFHFASSPESVLDMRRGLEPSVIRSLPVLIFHPDEFKDGLDCAVCLCEVSEGEKARLLPKCNHGFHVDCIDMWFQTHSTCPLCRNSVAPQSSNSSPQLPEIHSPTSDYSMDSPNFPGNETRVSIEGLCSASSSSSSFPSSPNSRRERRLVIELPRQLSEGFSSLSPSASQSAEEESNSPMSPRLRYLKWFLSREERVIPCSPSYVDAELGEGGRGQTSKQLCIRDDIA